MSDTKVRNAKPAEKQYAIADGQGLSILVRPNGTKLWLYRYRFGGRRCRSALSPASDSRPRAKTTTPNKLLN
ncbi:Arm DNA-binding domain-containing protein [Pseudorhodoplanes sinuspersici]|uniref:Integrase DNA-binding domain-containing protein n=1 Tax=Pseudorhodoplanes sinuspersici TaxID=1235591 RepID=A0A1W6ZS93_9HYPH|nr:hypothetical protein CAK95_11410 [Pseudorhodoplanes sinuspersici]